MIKMFGALENINFQVLIYPDANRKIRKGGMLVNLLQDADFYVSNQGCNTNPGTQERPFATIERAQEAVRQILENNTNRNITVCVREGTYYLEKHLVFDLKDSGTKDLSVLYASYPGEKPTISGGKRISCKWKPYRDGIMMCELSDVREGKLDFDQLFINDKRQILARYPNQDNSNPVDR